MLNIIPSKKEFTGNPEAGGISPLYAELPYLPPRQIFESIEKPYSFLLESIKGPEKIARYSFIGSEPFLVFKVKNGAVEIIVKMDNITVTVLINIALNLPCILSD